MRKEVENPMLLPEPNYSSGVRTVPITLPDNFYAEYDDLNDRLAAQARVEAKRRKGGAA